MKKLKTFYYTIIKHKFLFALIVAIILIMAFIFFPRNLKNLLVHNNNTTFVEIVRVADHEHDVQEISLNKNQRDQLLALFKNSYVRLKVFRKKYITGKENFMGYLIMLPDTMDTVYFFSSDIICINEIQYKVYGQTLANKFKSIIESEE